MTTIRKKLAGKTSKVVKSRSKQADYPAKVNDYRAGSITKSNPLKVSRPEADPETIERRRKNELLIELQDLIRIIDEQIN